MALDQVRNQVSELRAPDLALLHGLWHVVQQHASFLGRKSPPIRSLIHQGQNGKRRVHRRSRGRGHCQLLGLLLPKVIQQSFHLNILRKVLLLVCAGPVLKGPHRSRHVL